MEAGGGTDTVVRSLAKPLGDALGVTVLVQNAPGAGGGVAASKVASAAAGWTHHCGDNLVNFFFRTSGDEDCIQQCRFRACGYHLSISRRYVYESGQAI